jgi:hypothetical protein
MLKLAVALTTLALALVGCCVADVSTGTIVTVFYEDEDCSALNMQTISFIAHKAGCQLADDDYHGSVDVSCTDSEYRVTEYPAGNTNCAAIDNPYTDTTALKTCEQNYGFSRMYCDSIPDNIASAQGYDVQLIFYQDSECTKAGAAVLTKSDACLGTVGENEVKITLSGDKFSMDFTSATVGRTCDGVDTTLIVANADVNTCVTAQDEDGDDAYIKVIVSSSTIAESIKSSPAASSASGVLPVALQALGLFAVLAAFF